MQEDQQIIYEQPVTEQARILLRIEHLQQQIECFVEYSDTVHQTACLKAIADLLHLLDRPDLRNKFAHECQRYCANLSKLKSVPTIDQEMLSATIGQFKEKLQQLQHNKGKFAQDLRENEFISNLRQHYHLPAGTVGFQIPCLRRWLSQTEASRYSQLSNWVKQLEPLFAMTSLSLNLLRSTTTPVQRVAEKGVFQMPLDPAQPIQIVQIICDEGLGHFPRISVSRHAMSLRFIPQSFTTGTNIKKLADIKFKVATCVF